MGSKAKATHYSGVAAAYIAPSDVAGTKNLSGVRYIQVCTTAGTVTFRHKDGSLSVPIPIALNQSFEIGYDMENIMATDTTAVDIAAYY